MEQTLFKASEEVIKQFKDTLSFRGMEHLDFEVIHKQNLKPSKDGSIGKVILNNDILVFAGAKRVIFIINEDYFNELDEYKGVYVDKLINCISYDMEKDKFSKNTFDEYLGVVKKHGIDTVEGLNLAIKQIAERKKEEKT